MIFRLARTALTAPAALTALALALPAVATASAETPIETPIETPAAPAKAPAGPQRIVSLLPSLTESVCALGACDRLVGIDRHANWPASVQALPRLGGVQDPDMEGILALRPDLVLLDEGSRAASRLQALGLRVQSIRTQTQDEVRQGLIRLARILALPPASAERAWAAIEQAIEQAARTLPAHARGARVFFEISSGPWAAGPSSFIGESIRRLGLGNIVPDELGPFPRLNPEFVLAHPPEIIMATSHSQLARAPYPGWQNLPAWREQRLCLFTRAETDVLVRPGPRMAEGVRLIARCVADKLPAPGANKSTHEIDE